MSAERYSYIEQDLSVPQGRGDDDLPTYDDLAAQSGPNSRFGRWRGWIEKRAAERYNDLTPEERARRRERGWGNDDNMTPLVIPKIIPQPSISQPNTPIVSDLHIHQKPRIGSSKHQEPYPRLASPPLPPLPFYSQQISPSYLKLNNFGSRFLPHTISPIRCLLPLLSGRLLLIGHDEGLSVLDMFPQEEDGSIVKGPDEATCRPIWEGEGVFQMTILEIGISDDSQGVVLVLVGPDPITSPGKDSESMRTLRMYNLASLVSLAKYAVSRKKNPPLRLPISTPRKSQSPIKRHRPQASIARGLKSLIDTPILETPSPYLNLLSPINTTNGQPGRTTPSSDRASSVPPGLDESGWDFVEELPLRWATDYVALATPGSRLVNTSVLSYAIWSDENRKGWGGQLLAVATKSNILLYETPKHERAFRFVKEFYTPLPPRSISFMQQTVTEINRRVSDSSGGRFLAHSKSGSQDLIRAVGENPTYLSTTLCYGTHLSLFVIFDKKAGWIRLADSAVGEMEFYDTSLHSTQTLLYPSEAGTSSMRSKNRASIDPHAGGHKWIPPTYCEVPIPGSSGASRKIHLLTRGRQTQLLPHPLSSISALQPPILVVNWNFAPTHVAPRVCKPGQGSESLDAPPFLQLIAFGENGIEVREISTSSLSIGRSAGKARFEEPIRAEVDLGGDVGFLCYGGHWDHASRLFNSRLSRNISTSTAITSYSLSSTDSEDLPSRMKREEGLYGWCRKGLEDWRVFWVGGTPSFDDGADRTDSVDY